MKVAIMQPYFFPYLGYFQLMNAVNIFIVYDNIQFSKKGWIQRNRILHNGKDELFSLPLKKDSDFLDIKDRRLADDYLIKNKKTLRKIEDAYSKAPHFQEVFPLIQKCFLFERQNNLFDFLLFSINELRSFLSIKSDIKISSELEGQDDRLKNKTRVIHLCKKINAATYINPIGGQQLYSKLEFKNQGLLLEFIKMHELKYRQFDAMNFIPNLSIIDVMMFNSKSDIAMILDNYDLV
jgi:hypothetical protein